MPPTKVEYIHVRLPRLTAVGHVTATRIHRGLTYHYIIPTDPKRLPKWRTEHDIIKVLK